jgi:hypothetical protein
MVGIPIALKDLNDVLIMDVGDKVRCRRARAQASALCVSISADSLRSLRSFLPQPTGYSSGALTPTLPRAQIRDSGKWPLVIDVSGQASVFLRYLDTNYGAIRDSRTPEAGYSGVWNVAVRLLVWLQSELPPMTRD